jgi:hypothetical protein
MQTLILIGWVLFFAYGAFGALVYWTEIEIRRRKYNYQVTLGDFLLFPFLMWVAPILFGIWKGFS